MIDVVLINNEAFLHTISQRIKCPNVIVLGTNKGQMYNKVAFFAGLDHVLLKYNHADVLVTKIHYNRQNMLNQLKRRQLTNALPRKEADTGTITVSIFCLFYMYI